MEPVGFRARSKLAVSSAEKFEPGVEPLWLWTSTFGAAAIENARYFIAAKAWDHLDVEWLYSAPAVWTKSTDRMPAAGQLIVKRWANGNVWAGIYRGGPKESSFDEWKAI